MSSIDKLLIRGVRSFDPNSDVENVIKFYSPLTIIVGHNGAGKTTIIECLKYATTGDLPPNSKGGAFIHDPKLAHEREVKAQIKLKFRNINGSDVVCTRSIQLTQKKGGSAVQKTLESLLTILDPNTGAKRSISNRCQELDEEMILQLGVSKAILDNVIFCHQEESNWPLSEPSVLKKKFDDIFASTRYTKALDNMKTLRKERAVEIKVDMETLKHLESNKLKAVKVRDKLADTDYRITTTSTRIEELQTRLDKVVEDIAESLAHQQEALKFRNTVSDVERDHHVKSETRANLANNITIMHESDDELLKINSEQTDRVASTTREIQELQAQESQLSREIARLRKMQSQLLQKRGQLESDANAHDLAVQKRDDLVRQMARANRLRGLDVDPLTAADVQRFFEKCQGEVDDRQRSLDDVQAKHRSSESDLSQKIQQITADISNYKYRSTMTRQSLDTNNRNISQALKKLETIRVTQAEVDEQGHRLRQEEAALQDAQLKSAASDMDTVLASLDRQFRDAEDQVSTLQQEMTQINMQADTRARLQIKKNDHDRKQEILREMIRKHEPEIKMLLKSMGPVDQLVRQTEELVRRKDADVQRLENLYSQQSLGVSRVESQLGHVRSELSKKEMRLKDCCDMVRAVCGDEDYAVALKFAENAFDDAKEDALMLNSTRDTFASLLKKADRTHKCSLCDRPFPSDSEVTAFLRKLEKKLDASDVEKCNAESRDAETRLAELRSVHSAHEDMIRLRDVEIPGLRSQITESERQKEKLVQEVEDTFSTLAAEKSERESANILKMNVAEIARYDREVNLLISEVNKLEAELSRRGSSKTIDELQVAYQDASDKSKSVKRDIDRIKNEKESRQRQLQMYEIRVRDARTDLKEAQSRLQGRLSLEENIEELRATNQKHQTEIQNSSKEVRTLQPRADLLQTELTDLQRQNQITVTEAQSEMNRLKNDLARIATSQQDIEQYIKRDTAGQLAECVTQVSNLDVQIENGNAKMKDLQEKVTYLTRRLDTVHEFERNVSDNLRLRELDREIVALGTRLGQLRKEAAAFDKRSYRQQQEVLSEQQNNLTAEIAGLHGENRQLQNQKQSLQKELQTDYRNVDEERNSQFIKVTTSEMANEDLEKYSKALDNAIMRFHSLKMDEINKTIRELWMSTYKGNDVDTIEIRSDAENTRGNRSYNYRVVLIKGDSVLDMRGRCSAGQKVLASIIIRLALAESFGLNCGILALDEPTTNLDRENIESLAESMKRIILARRQQKNFQLIIITHDEDFMRLLGRSEFADFYYRVRKDENQHSVIERQAISQVT